MLISVGPQYSVSKLYFTVITVFKKYILFYRQEQISIYHI